MSGFPLSARREFVLTYIKLFFVIYIVEFVLTYVRLFFGIDITDGRSTFVDVINLQTCAQYVIIDRD